MALSRSKNLNHVLWRLLAAVIAPLLLGTLGLLALQATQESAAARTRLGALAQTLVQAVEAEFDRGRVQLEVLAESPLLDAGRLDELRDFAARVAAKVPGSLILLVGPDGQTLFNTVAPAGEPMPNLWQLGAESRQITWQGRSLPLSSGNLSRQAFESGRAVYSDLYYGLQVQQPTLSVSIPVVRDGRSRYALILAYPPSLLQERIRSAVTVPSLRAILLDRRGLVVATNEETTLRLGDRPPAPPEPLKAAGFYQLTALDGTRLSGAYAVSPEKGFMVRVAQPVTGSVLPTRLTTLAWLAMLLAALAVSLLLAGVLSRRLARPLRELGEDVRAGREPAPGRETGIAEIDLLAQALREGARAERQRVEEQMLRTVAQNQEALLRQADRQKDEFLATLAHELRNPLAPIRTAVELIRLRAPDDPVVERARSAIERQTAHLSHLVDDLLDVSRITLGRIHLRLETVNLGDVVASAAESIAEAVGAAGLVLEQEIVRPAPFVRGDATRLTQCVVNLLNNAVKFNAPGGRLRLVVSHHGGTAVIEVQDSGVGIAPANLERIFDLFVQERHSGHGGNTGLGIGLALTRRLVELHGGSIRATSAGPGRGSTFRIELPCVQAPAESDAPVLLAAAPERAQASVLVVDDNRDAAETLAELLGMSGFRVELAHDGASALRAVAAQAPDAVLLDIGLPDIDGYEVCRRIRADAGLPHRPVLVAVTGWGQQSDRDAATAAGFDVHLTKPVAPEAVIALLDERLRR